MLLHDIASVEHVYAWCDAELHKLLQFLFRQILVENAQSKLALRLDQHFLEGQFDLLALLAVLLPIEYDNRVLVRRDILPELSRGPDSLFAETVLG